jgi:predicted dinucleotide-binding enzyme
MAIAGDDLVKKQIVMDIVNDLGFIVDSGSLDNSLTML